jgi:molybdopterin synthase sulfur carrier subunit
MVIENQPSAGDLKVVDVRYFAILREQRGLSAERIQTRAATAKALYEELRARHGFTLKPERMRAAINDEFTGWEAVLRDGDSIGFIPPVAGG